MNIRTITTTLWNNDTTDHLAARDMMRNQVAKITTTAGHIMALEVEEDEDGAFITYSIYAPGDEEMTDGPITTDGFPITTEDDAATHLASILADY